MKNILSHFLEEQITLYSQQPATELIAEIDAVMEHTRGWNFSPNLAGKIDPNGFFKISFKYEFMYISGNSGMSAVMEGRVYINESGSLIETSVRPNWSFLILALGFLGMGLAAPILSNSSDPEIWIAAFICVFIVPVAMALCGKQRKDALIANFKEAFNLSVQASG